MRMVKKPLNLLVDRELIIKARDYGIVISRFLEKKLEEHFALIDAVSNVKGDECSRRDLNPGLSLERA